MKYRKILNLLIVLFLSASATGQRAITLQEAVQLSLANSKQLQASKARVLQASATVKQALDARLPDATASASYLRVLKPHVALHTGKDSAGGSGSGGSNFNVSQALYGLVNVSLPIYAGHRIQYGIEAAKYLEKATTLDVEHDRSEVALNAMEAFINLYKAKAATALVKESLEQNRKRVADFTNLEKNGLLARNDLLKAQLQESNVELSELEAESNLKLATVNMDLMLGLAENTELVPDSASLQAPPAVQTLDYYEQTALQGRADVQALTFRQKAAATNIKSVNAEKYPALALSGGYVSAYIPNFISITNAVNAGIGIQYSISSLWKNDAKLKQAQAREQEITAMRRQMDDAVRLQVNKAYENYLLSQKKIDVYAKAVEQAQENYRISKNKYENSLLTTTELLDADVAQLQAQLNHRFAKADALVTYYRLLVTAGAITLEQ